MVGIEQVFEPLDVVSFAAQSVDCQYAKLEKLGVAVAVLDPDDRLLVIEHEGRDLNYPQGSVSPPLETVKYVEGRGVSGCESPVEAGVRGLMEELPINWETMLKAGLSLGSRPLTCGRWELGVRQGIAHYVLGYTLGLQVDDPDMLLSMQRQTHEGGHKRFVEISELMEFDDSELRPGTRGWLEEHGPLLKYNVSQQISSRIDEFSLPTVGIDVRFDT